MASLQNSSVMSAVSGDGSIKFPSQLLYLATFVSIICGSLIIIHAIYPQFTIDSTTIALVIILIFPWLLPYLHAYLKSIKLPGGTEITFRDELQKLEKLSERSAVLRLPVEGVYAVRPAEPSLSTLFRADPNLALASLRIEIEKRLLQIAKQKELRVGISVKQILSALHSREIIGSSEFKVLNLIIDICNKAIHAEKVETSTAAEILRIGESALIYLDSVIH